MAGYIFEDDNESINFEFYDAAGCRLYNIDFDAQEISEDVPYGDALNDLYSVQITQGKVNKGELDKEVEEIDDSVKSKVANIISDFFNFREGSSIIFSVENGDLKQDIRVRLFESWYQTNHNREDYLYNIYKLENRDEKTIQYIGLVIKNNNPNRDLILQSFEMFTIAE